ncbi:MAG: toprim domain-containing protein [Planctomycetaceae bacterium]
MNDVDQLIEQTSVDQVLTYYGKPPTTKTSGEHRLQCVFNEACADSQYGNLTIRLDDPINRIYCHSCGVRGNLLTLLHGLEYHRPPTGDKLRGDEFKAAVAKLREIAGQLTTETGVPRTTPASPVVESPTPQPVNVPLVRHEKEAARELANLCDELVTDVALMSPEAAQYVRKRPWMTPKLMQKWGVGWIPGNGRSLFRKNYLVYTHRNLRGEVISYSGRDVSFETKWQKWLRDGKPEGKKPNKHRYVTGYHKGQELYGSQSTRLKEPYVQESLNRRGIVVVEGMNEVLRLETLGVAAIALGSNKATDTQIEKLTRFAKQAAHNRITLLPDCDEEGESAFKDLLWKLAEHQVQVRLACTSHMFNGHFAGLQPEDLSEEQWQQIEELFSENNPPNFKMVEPIFL